MACLRSRVYCEENVVVDFFLTVHNVENMDVFIYHPKKVVEDCFDETHSLVGIVIVHHNEIMFEKFPDDNIQYQYYLIGFECLKKIQLYPKSILGWWNYHHYMGLVIRLSHIYFILILFINNVHITIIIVIVDILKNVYPDKNASAKLNSRPSVNIIYSVSILFLFLNPKYTE